MKILVAIANYGTKNNQYAERVIQEFRSMPFAIDIVVLSEAPKHYGQDVKVMVGLPWPDPWALPFAHKKIFADNLGRYDLFVYLEDDTLIRAHNVRAFFDASRALDKRLLPGFMRYEIGPCGRKNYPDIFSHYHWIPDSVSRAGDYQFARFTNDHAACYMLTAAQLHTAIGSGGYLVAPHSGRYDLICSAGTDPYTQCGFTRVVCYSHIDSFEVHHLSNAYVGRVGLDERSFLLQINALSEVMRLERCADELFPTEKPIATSMWDKSYYEPRREDLADLLSPTVRDILTIGCGSGETEALLAEQGRRVTAIPLDCVIAALVERKGIEVLPPDLARAQKKLGSKTFDAVLISEVLQHVREPVKVLAYARSVLKRGGVVVGSVPNLSLLRRLSGRFVGRNRKFSRLGAGFEHTLLNVGGEARIRKWLRAAHLDATHVRYHDAIAAGRWSGLASKVPMSLRTRGIVFGARA